MKFLVAFAAFVFLGAAPLFAQRAEYVENRFRPPVGPYFLIDRTYYRIKGAEEVSGIGSYGRVSGKGWLGPLTPNGYKANGALGVLPELETRAAVSKGESILNAMLSGNMAAETPVGDTVVGADGAFLIDMNREYTVLVVRPRNWSALYARLNAAYREGDEGVKSRFRDPKFRVVDNVVYSTSMRLRRLHEVNGRMSAGSTLPEIEISAEIEGESAETQRLELTGKQVIAYSYRRLCWSGETIVEAREDHPGPSDISNCRNY